MIEGLVEQFTMLNGNAAPVKIEHRLVDILEIAICAVVAETFEDTALYGRCKEAWLRGLLELPGGIPSHDAFRRVFMLIDPDAFERCFLAWVRGACRSDQDSAAAGPEQVAVDGSRWQGDPLALRSMPRPLTLAPGQRVQRHEQVTAAGPIP